MARKGRKPKSPDQLREKLNLTMHPEVRDWAEELCFRGRRSLSRLFEDLVEAEWQRMKNPPPPAPAPAPAAPQAQPPFYYYPQPYPHYYAAPQAPQQPQQ
jgi:hypothetical protein